MALLPFRTESDSYSTSVTMDASTVGDTTVTVAVHAPRELEPAILEAIYDHGSAIGFKPFYNKANDFEHATRQDFTEAVLEEFPEHIRVLAHRQSLDGNEDTQQVEAVHSAIHVHDILETVAEPPAVIVDGNEQQAKPFVAALDGLRDNRPLVAHCQKSEFYYPAALLADLASNHLAHRINATDTMPPTGELVIPAPRAKQHRAQDWGRAISATYRNSPEYTPPTLPALRGNTVRERVNCWYEGAVMPHEGVDEPMSDSVTRVVNALQRNGYHDLAEKLREL
jgi:hypothetical protein